MITERDKVLLAKKGISEDKLNTQLACFAKGFPYLRLAAAASTEKGILACIGRCQSHVQEYVRVR